MEPSLDIDRNSRLLPNLIYYSHDRRLSSSDGLFRSTAGDISIQRVLTGLVDINLSTRFVLYLIDACSTPA